MVVLGLARAKDVRMLCQATFHIKEAVTNYSHFQAVCDTPGTLHEQIITLFLEWRCSNYLQTQFLLGHRLRAQKTIMPAGFFFLMKFGVLATSVLVDISKIAVQRLGSNIALSHCLMNNVKLAGFACCAKVIKPDL